MPRADLGGTGGSGRNPRPSAVWGAAGWACCGASLIGLLLAPGVGRAHEALGSPPAKMVRQAVEGKAPDFALLDQAGRPLALWDLRGRVVLLTFIYSSCSEVCPLITRTMTELQRRLGSGERKRIFFLAVTVEPEVDTPVVLRAYARRHGADLSSWAFLTGSPEAVREVWQAFGMTVTRRAPKTVSHPGWTFLIDREGMVRYRYLGAALEVKTVLEDLRRL